MSKTTVPRITISIAGDPPVLIRPATNATTVHTVATSVAGNDQTISVQAAS